MKTPLLNEEPSQIKIFRDKYLEKKIELIDITQLCEFKLGRSGSCNGINEPNDEIYHIQIWYRDETIANVLGKGIEVIEDKKYVLFVTDDDDDFIIFRKAPVV